MSLLTLLHSSFSFLTPSAHALGILTVPRCVFAFPQAFPQVSAGSSPSLSSSPCALSQVAQTGSSTLLSASSTLYFGIFNTSRFTGFFSTDFSVLKDCSLQVPPALMTPQDVCVCVCECVLCVWLCYHRWQPGPNARLPASERPIPRSTPMYQMPVPVWQPQNPSSIGVHLLGLLI